MSLNLSQAATGLVNAIKKVSYTLRELLQLPVKPQQWLLENYMPKKVVSGLMGASDCGKSTFARQLAMAVANRDSHFVGIPLSTDTGVVVYVCTEDDEDHLNRVSQLVTPTGAALDNLHFIFCQEGVTKEIDELGLEKIDLIIVDMWGDLFQGEPNNFVKVRQDLNIYKKLASKYGASILIMHHTGKRTEHLAASKNSLNGSQAIEAAMRSLFELRKEKDGADSERVLTIVKGNRVSEAVKKESLLLNLDTSTLTFSNGGKLIQKGKDVTVADKVAKWIPLARELRKQGKSFVELQAILTGAHGDTVPKVTWFKEHIDDLIGRTDDTIEKQPTDHSEDSLSLENMESEGNDDSDEDDGYGFIELEAA